MALCPLDILGKRSNPKCSSQNMECFALSKGVFHESGNTFKLCLQWIFGYKSSNFKTWIV